MTDPISDFLTRIRNASRAGHRSVDVPASRIKEGLANILKEQGFIEEFERIDEGPQGVIRMKLRYVNGSPAMLGLRRVSRPGLRRYAGATELPRVRNGLGIAVISTSHGLMTDKEARRRNVGGEVLCYVW
ncbi:MAG: 30S ribosomal protein S8 [Ignavibacteriae bacterium]|nr:30S ribosomal protein S8 [Ignavibacteriota bacterium]MCB9216300.1 30S ribosomal protein S8 [Ignavibacteria bacterium]